MANVSGYSVMENIRKQNGFYMVYSPEIFQLSEVLKASLRIMRWFLFPTRKLGFLKKMSFRRAKKSFGQETTRQNKAAACLHCL